MLWHAYIARGKDDIVKSPRQLGIVSYGIVHQQQHCSRWGQLDEKCDLNIINHKIFLVDNSKLGYYKPYQFLSSTRISWVALVMVSRDTQTWFEYPIEYKS